MQQIELIHETFADALKEAIRALGGSKVVGPKLRPAKGQDGATRWLLDCLSADRREKFDPEDILWLMREGRRAGCHAVMHYACSESGYAAAQPIEPEDEMARLQRVFIESVKDQKQILQRMEKLTGGSPLKAVA